MRLQDAILAYEVMVYISKKLQDLAVWNPGPGELSILFQLGGYLACLYTLDVANMMLFASISMAWWP